MDVEPGFPSGSAAAVLFGSSAALAQAGNGPGTGTAAALAAFSSANGAAAERHGPSGNGSADAVAQGTAQAACPSGEDAAGAVGLLPVPSPPVIVVTTSDSQAWPYV
jgi:hypothetical protein